MADDARFSADKAVDRDLVFAEGRPEWERAMPFAGLLDAVHGGVRIEAGVESIADDSAEAVLANPEIAHHRLGESIVHDPAGPLAG